MRTVKFRGRDQSGVWHYGNLSILEIKYGNAEPGYYFPNKYGHPHAYKVIPETVGQFIGMTDCKGKEIYEGDIMELTENNGLVERTYHSIVYGAAEDKNYPAFDLSPAIDCDCNGLSYLEACGELNYRVIGTIHDPVSY